MASEGSDRLRLLHVDDHSSVVRPLASRLEAHGGYRVTVERDAAAALEALETVAYDCVLLAEAVASTSAAEFCRRLRASGSECPVLVLAADPESAVADGVLEAGATDVVDASSDAFLRILRQRIDLAVAAGGRTGTTSLQRHLSDLPLGTFVETETLAYANDAFLDLLDVDGSVDGRSLADVLGRPLPDAERSKEDATVERRSTAGGDDPTRAVTVLDDAPAVGDTGPLAFWTSGPSDEDDAIVGAVWDLDAGSGTLGRHWRSHAVLESLLRDLPAALAIRDANGTYVAVNDAFTELGPGTALTSPDGAVFHDPDDVAGATDHDLFPPELAAARRRVHERVLRRGTPAADWRDSLVVGDRAVELAASVVPWTDHDGTVVGSVEVLRDVTAAERTRRAADAREIALAVARDVATGVRTDGNGPGATGGDAIGPLAALLDAGASAAPGSLEPVSLDAACRDAIADLRRATATQEEADDGADALALEVRTDAVVRADPGPLRMLLRQLFALAAGNGAQTVAVGSRDGGFYVEGDGAPLDRGQSAPTSLYEALAVGAGGDGDASASDDASPNGATDDAASTAAAIVDLVAAGHGWRLSVGDGASGGRRVDVTGVQFR